jgi:dinuclear metal center YbgI/SA1388 family protein
VTRAKETIAVADLVRHLDDIFPFAWAEPWDRVGLLAGDPGAPVSQVLVSLDPTPEALSMAVAHGANVLVTHHPAFLQPPSALTPERAGVVYQAVSLGVALVACHTNLDRAPAAGDELPRLLGLTSSVPLERGRQPVSLVTVFVPAAHAQEVLAAMAAAGAGRVGGYRACAFRGPGIGSFVPGEGTTPALGSAGERTDAEEVRLEMACDRSSVDGVVLAARRAHPYEEPLIVVTDADVDRGSARLGRVCELSRATTVRAVAERVAKTFSIVPRVWGDPDARVSTVGTVSGSGGSLLPDAISAEVSVLVTGEVRYHQALEALDAGLAVIEAGHDVTEWPHVPVIASALRAHELLAGRVVMDQPAQRWWTP